MTKKTKKAKPKKKKKAGANARKSAKGAKRRKLMFSVDEGSLEATPSSRAAKTSPWRPTEASYAKRSAASQRPAPRAAPPPARAAETYVGRPSESRGSSFDRGDGSGSSFDPFNRR
jgi:hypothetical protein